jgi:hypothetical protein
MPFDVVKSWQDSNLARPLGVSALEVGFSIVVESRAIKPKAKSSL